MLRLRVASASQSRWPTISVTLLADVMPAIMGVSGCSTLDDKIIELVNMFLGVWVPYRRRRSIFQMSIKCGLTNDW